MRSVFGIICNVIGSKNAPFLRTVLIIRKAAMTSPATMHMALPAVRCRRMSNGMSESAIPKFRSGLERSR